MNCRVFCGGGWEDCVYHIGVYKKVSLKVPYFAVASKRRYIFFLQALYFQHILLFFVNYRPVRRGRSKAGKHEFCGWIWMYALRSVSTLVLTSAPRDI